jgi:hypothetical protein
LHNKTVTRFRSSEFDFCFANVLGCLLHGIEESQPVVKLLFGRAPQAAQGKQLCLLSLIFLFNCLMDFQENSFHEAKHGDAATVPMHAHVSAHLFTQHDAGLLFQCKTAGGG